MRDDDSVVEERDGDNDVQLADDSAGQHVCGSVSCGGGGSVAERDSAAVRHGGEVLSCVVPCRSRRWPPTPLQAWRQWSKGISS